MDSVGQPRTALQQKTDADDHRPTRAFGKTAQDRIRTGDLAQPDSWSPEGRIISRDHLGAAALPRAELEPLWGTREHTKTRRPFR